MDKETAKTTEEATEESSTETAEEGILLDPAEVNDTTKVDIEELFDFEDVEDDSTDEKDVDEDKDSKKVEDDEEDKGDKEEDEDKDDSSEGHTSEPEDDSNTTAVKEPDVDPQVSALTSQVEKLTALVGELSAGNKSTDTDSSKSESDIKSNIKTLADLFNEVDVDEALDSTEGFMSLMAGIANVIQEQTASQLVSNIPQLVTTQIKTQSDMEKIHADFYKANPELVNIKGYVGQVANEVSTKEPNLTVDEILTETVKLVRTSMGLGEAPAKKQENTPPPKGSKSSPALPGSKKARKSSPKLTELQSEIDEILMD